MFEELLKKELDGIQGIKLISASYNKNEDCLMINLSYPDGIKLTSEQREQIKSVSKKIADIGIKNVSVQLKKAYISPEYAIAEVRRYIEQNYPLMYSFTKNCFSAKVADGLVIIEVQTGSDIKGYIAERNIKDNTEKYLSKEFLMPVSLEINYVEEDAAEEDFEIEYTVAEDLPCRHIKIYNTEKYIGESITEQPIYISDIKSAADNIVVCGKIEYYELKEFTTKSGKNRHIAKFMLKDPTGEIHAFMFVSEASYAKMEKLENGIEIVVYGSCEQGKYENLEIKCKYISLCEIDKNFKEEIIFKSEPKNYTKVFPEKLEYKEQLNLFDVGRKISPFLQNNDIVVFDLETTGLNFTSAEIIEIGAVKIKRGGVISERFSTFVKPSKSIPPEITALTGITDADVATGIDIDTALADFYKFTRDCTLVGHNINFDYGFIDYYGKKVGYDFSKNPLQDTYGLSQKYLPSLKNHKLKTVAEHFNISLKNAHRAYNDAYATAEVFMKLTDFFE